MHCPLGLLSPRKHVWGQVLSIPFPPTHPHTALAMLTLHLSGIGSKGIPSQNAPNQAHVSVCLIHLQDSSFPTGLTSAVIKVMQPHSLAVIRRFS